ncbi:MAG: ABC transporter permease [Kibdelosporangium sp.]
MTDLIRAEFIRLVTTRLWVWALVAALGTGGLIGVLALVGPENFDPPLPGLQTEEGARTLLGIAGFLVFIPALIGATAVTSEFRHRTITPTFLASPRRGRVLIAKLITYAVAGAVYGITAAVFAGAGLYAGAAVHGVELGLSFGTIVGLLARIAAAMIVYTVLGVGVGALLRSQVAAIAILGAYLYLIESLLLLIPGVRTIYPYLPGGATAALTNFTQLSKAVAEQTGSAAVQLVSAPVGVLLLAGYGIVAAVLAVAAPLRRDIA